MANSSDKLANLGSGNSVKAAAVDFSASRASCILSARRSSLAVRTHYAKDDDQYPKSLQASLCAARLSCMGFDGNEYIEYGMGLRPSRWVMRLIR